ncbi:MAG: VTT domain-containing protein [Bacteroidales bacterium]|nr:VTT domain-containing protein [Bacteroidales bacterium]
MFTFAHPEKGNMRKIILQLLYLLAVILIVFVFFYYELNIYFSIANINKVKVHFLDLGFYAPLLMIGFYIILNLAAIPRVFFTIFSGYVFGIVYGFLFAWMATIIGLAASFLMVRYLFRTSFERRFGNKKLVEKINNQIDKRGVWLIIFLRAIYVVPSSILNYSFGFTKIKTRDYLLGSAIGFIPVVLINVAGGNALANQVEFGFDYKVLALATLVLTLMFFVSRWVKERISL